MYKKITAFICRTRSCYIYKPLFIMKLSFFLSALIFLQASAVSFAQKVSLNVRSASINEVFFKLTQQTGHTFTADADLIKKLHPINLNVKNATLREVLDRCFS